jgi:RHS repeat-associated protein
MDRPSDAMHAARAGRSIRRSLFCLATLCAASSPAHATTVAAQWYSRVDRPGISKIDAEGAFGERTNPKTGSTSFSATDVQVDVNSGLKLSFGRVLLMNRQQLQTTSTQYFAHYSPNNPWGVDPSLTALGAHWELDVPYLSGVYDYRTGWISAGPNPAERCSAGLAPPTVMGIYPYYSQPFQPKSYWDGISVNIPGVGQEALLRIAPNAAKPADGRVQVAATASGARASCLATIKNGTGQGFRLVLPNGTTYYFDWMARRNLPPIMNGGSTMLSGNPFDRNTIAETTSPQVVLPLVRAYLYATRVEDRFGNWIEYDYDPANPLRLKAIRSNEAPPVSVTYGAQGHVSTVSHGGRTWQYQYAGDGHHLHKVIHPDGSFVEYTGFGGLSALYGEREDDVLLLQKFCTIRTATMSSDRVPEPGDTATITIRLPSGATGSFSFRELVHGTSRTPGGCHVERVYSQTPSGVSYYDVTTLDGAPMLNRVASLYKRQITGPGMPAAEWNYVYQPSWSYLSACPSPSSCTTTAKTLVTNPDGSTTRMTFGNDYASNEGELLSKETIWNGTVVAAERTTYLDSATNQAYPESFGVDPNEISNPLLGKYRPVLTVERSRDGDTFTSSVDQCGGAGVYCFDALARQTRVRRASSLGYSGTMVTDYHDDLSRWVLGQVRRRIDAVTGRVLEETTYNASSLPSATYKLGKLQQTLTYHPDGTLATLADGAGNVTSVSGWTRGIPRLISFADGTTQSATVDTNTGWITSITDENGYTTGYGYDAMGRLASITRATGDVLVDGTTGYFPSWAEYRALTDADWKPDGVSTGQWRKLEGTGNHITVTFYDAMWRPVLTHDYDQNNITGSLRSVRMEYDASGRKRFESYPSSAVVPGPTGIRTAYDALDRVTRTEHDSELDVLATTTEYLSGLKVRVTNARGQQTTTQFMAWDQPSYDLPVLSVQPEGKVIEILRDPQLGWPLSMRQRSAVGGLSHTRTYVYDGHGQLCKTIEPETGATVMGYDAAGNPSWSAAGLDASSFASTTDCQHGAAYASGRVSTRSYDRRNRLLTLSFPDGRGNQVWTYAPDGKPASVTAYSGANGAHPVVTTYDYNRRRLLTRESLSQPNWYTWSIAYAYDAYGNLASQTYPTGLTVDYAPNPLGQATRAGSFATGAQYYPNGALRQFTYGNGIVHTMTQNVRQLPSRVTSNGATDYSYAYDANGNVTNIWDLARGDHYSRWMTYDNLDRLTSAGSASFGGDAWHRFTYDALDNLESWTLPGVKDYADYVYDARNRLTEIRNTPGAPLVGLSYDVQGNLSTRNGQAYEFDFGNRLRSVPGREWYRYDGLGRRVQTTSADGSKTTNWQYAQSGQMVFWSDFQAPGQSNQKTHENVYLAGSLVATIDHDWPSNAVLATRYQHTDALGSPVAVTDEAARVVDRNDHEPYGAVIGKPTFAGIGYTGHVMDGATGLTYMQQRYYDASIGRFLSVDPVAANAATGANFSRYWYGDNNPYKFTDPDGRQAQPTRPLASQPQHRIVTYMDMGITVYYDSKGTAVAVFDSRNDVTSKAKPGADGPYFSRNVTPSEGPHHNRARAYGPNDILTTDDVSRGRWLHGGGSRLANPLADRQGWAPTLGCTRLQNEDIQTLVDIVRAVKEADPGMIITYERLNYRELVLDGKLENNPAPIPMSRVPRPQLFGP